MLLSKPFQSLNRWLRTASPDALFDRQLVWIALGLMLIGLVMVTSASFPISSRLTDQPFHFMFRHAIFLMLALITSAVVLQVPLQRWM
ncbi:FtsW/RodA/SpoVE family cell cycle protein, partial [Vibrio fluvialis]